MYAQKYVPFPTENAEWNINYTTGTYGFPTTSYLKQYSLHGDTIINNITYRKLCTNIGTVGNPVYKGMGGLREQDKKIYYCGCNFWENFNYSSNEEVTLYDFNKVVGEVVMINNYTSYTITKIDSVKIGNSYRKRYNDRIIEGIGDVQEGLLGMITPRFTCMECIYNWQFICFSQNGESVYKNRDYVDCESTKKWSDVKYLNDNTCWTEFGVNIFTNDIALSRQYYLFGDTLINNKIYKKIFAGLPNITPQNRQCFDAIREESGRIYKQYNDITNGKSGEFLLYDFTVQTGDTIQSLSPNGALSRKMVVNSINFVELSNGEKRKRYNFIDASPWIEGIGCVQGFFKPAQDILTNGIVDHLVCFKQNDISYYNDASLCPSRNCCDLIQGLNEISQNNTKVSLSNNPLLSSTLFSWGNSSTFDFINLTNLLGKTVLTANINGLTEYKVTRSQLEKGLYIVQLLSKNGKQESLKLLVE